LLAPRIRGRAPDGLHDDRNRRLERFADVASVEYAEPNRIAQLEKSIAALTRRRARICNWRVLIGWKDTPAPSDGGSVMQLAASKFFCFVLICGGRRSASLKVY
jgi:hypothetical protein